ncbi:MAG: hypothetical protein ABJE66_30770 [Deltaproteobacteria bacterium]
MRVAVLVVACVFTRAAGVDARPGKVVRVERRTYRFTGEPRLCSVMPDQLIAYCYGKRPEPGTKLAVMDQSHVLGTLVVDKAEPLGNCKGAQSSLWSARLRNEGGGAIASPDSGVMGLLDVTVDSRHAKLVKVDDVPGDRPVKPETITAFDLDGDSKADLEFVGFSCDDSGNPVTSLPTGSPDQCVELWASTGHNYERLRTDRIGQGCY